MVVIGRWEERKLSEARGGFWSMGVGRLLSPSSPGELPSGVFTPQLLELVTLLSRREEG